MEPTKEYKVAEYAAKLQLRVKELRKNNPEITRRGVLLALGIPLYQAQKLGLDLPKPLTKLQRAKLSARRFNPYQG